MSATSDITPHWTNYHNHAHHHHAHYAHAPIHSHHHHQYGSHAGNNVHGNNHYAPYSSYWSSAGQAQNINAEFTETNDFQDVSFEHFRRIFLFAVLVL